MSESSVANLVCESGDASAVKSSESTLTSLAVCCDVCDIQLLSADWGNGPILALVKLLSAGIWSLWKGLETQPGAEIKHSFNQEQQLHSLRNTKQEHCPQASSASWLVHSCRGLKQIWCLGAAHLSLGICSSPQILFSGKSSKNASPKRWRQGPGKAWRGHHCLFAHPQVALSICLSFHQPSSVLNAGPAQKLS